MSLCRKCGKENLPNSTFCSSCGGKMTSNCDVSTEVAQQHLMDAASSIAAGVQEFSKIPHVGLKVSGILGVLGILIFFFPWAGFLGFSVSGFKIATEPRMFGIFSLLLFAIPGTCGYVSYKYYHFSQGAVHLAAIRKIMIKGGGLALAVQLAFYFITSNNLYGIDIFSGWFYLEFLVLLGMIIGVMFDKNTSQTGEGTV